MGMHSLFILGLWFRRIGSVTRYFIHNSPKLFLIRKMAQKIGDLLGYIFQKNQL